MDTRTIGLVIVVAGLGLAVLGGLIATGALSWFGRLPGDLRYESDSFKLYVPLASMLVVSVLLSVGVFLLSRLR